MIIQYVRDKNGEKKGVVVADLVDDKIRVGYSLCNLTKDKFDKHLALKIAEGRLLCNRRLIIPTTIKPLVDHVSERAQRYFKREII